MSYITTEALQNISIKTVEGFLNNKTPLSEGLAKQAMESGLNSEQIQRAVEATNSIAYLKVLQLSEDRTIEFPLCKFAEVMQKITIPEMSKVASLTIKAAGQPGKTELMMKTASEQFQEMGMTNSENMYYLTKLASQNDLQLEELKGRAYTIMPELHKAASVLKNDSLGLTKLARITNDQEFRRLSTLITGSSVQREDTGIFKSAELKEAQALLNLYKEAAELPAKIQACQTLHDRVDHIKQAGLLSMVGKGLGGIASVPFRATGAALKGFANNTKHNVGVIRDRGLNKVDNVIRGMEGRPAKTIPKVALKGGLGGLAVGGATMATDAAFYQPGKTSTGTSKDAWTALQKQ